MTVLLLLVDTSLIYGRIRKIPFVGSLRFLEEIVRLSYVQKLLPNMSIGLISLKVVDIVVSVDEAVSTSNVHLGNISHQ